MNNDTADETAVEWAYEVEESQLFLFQKAHTSCGMAAQNPCPRYVWHNFCEVWESHVVLCCPARAVFSGCPGHAPSSGILAAGSLIRTVVGWLWMDMDEHRAATVSGIFFRFPC